MTQSICRTLSSSSTTKIDLGFMIALQSRQIDRERRAVPHLALHCQRAAESLDDRFCNVQAQPQAAVVARFRGALEAMKYLRQHRRFDADTVIGHAHPHPFVGRVRRDVDRLSLSE